MESNDPQGDRTRPFALLTRGARVSQYTIVDKVGEGGMGEVFLAEDTELGRKVALKFLPSGIAADSELRSRFVREARALARQNHPNIVTVYEVGEHDGRPFFAMEYVAGQTLRQCSADRSQPTSTIIDWAIQICQGLGEAHRQGVVHRDIKSTNIVVDSQGRIRILDFGLAAVAGGEELTKTGSTLGTVAYMSPEQVSGRDIDHRSDLFSLGIVLYELITGHSPFRRDNEGATLRAIMQDHPEPIGRYAADIPEQIQQIVFKLLEKDRELRYQSAEGVLADLKKLLYDSQPSIAQSGRVSVDDKSIVVVPFDNMSAEADNEYFSDGLTEEIITDLSGLGDLRVISRASAMRLKGTDKDVRAIGRELNVRYILMGSVRRAGSSVRITAQLVDSSTDRQVWADKYKGTLDDIFEIQEQVSKAIVGTLKVKMTSTEEKHLAERPIGDARAYEFYLRAKQDLARWTEAGLDRAAVYLDQALAIEGDSPLLLATLAYVHYQYVNIGARPLDHFEKHRHYLDRALELNPRLPEALFVRAIVNVTYDNSAARTMQYLKEVLELAPGNVEAKSWLAHGLADVGRIEAARKLAAECLRDDPLSTHVLNTVQWVEVMDGNIQKAFDMVYDVYLKNPESMHQRIKLLHGLLLLGRLEEAEKYVGMLTGKSFYERLLLMFYHGMRGEYEKGVRDLTEGDLALSRSDHQYAMFVAEGFAVNNRPDEALDWLECSVDQGAVNYPYLSEYSPMLRSLDGDERFQRLMERVKKEWEEFPA